MLKTNIKHFNDLTLNEFHDLVALRMQVFVVEQDCPYQDLDGLDKDAYHLIVLNENHQTIGTVRILKAGVYYDEVAIGRVVSHEDFRHLKIGHLMMEKAIEFIAATLKSNRIRLSAQTHLKHFYEKHGFVSTGKEYLEDGIPHTEMLKA